MLEQTAKQQRRKMWHPDRDNPPPFRLQERDKQLLEIIYERRYATSDQIVEFFMLRHANGQQHSRNVIKGRLYKMFHHSLTTKPISARRLMKFSETNIPQVYGIGPESRKILLKNGHDRRRIKRLLKQAKEGSLYALEHTLEVNDFHISFVKSLISFADWQLIESRIEGTNAKQSWPIEEPDLKQRFRRSNYAVKPDELFCIEGPNPNAHGGRQKMWILTELERGTTSRRKWAWRIASYSEFFYRQFHLEPPFNMEKTQMANGKQVAMPSLKLAIMSPDRSFRDKIRGIARDADPESQGLRIFWFGLHEAYKNDPENLFGKHFLLPYGIKRYSLLDRQVS